MIFIDRQLSQTKATIESTSSIQDMIYIIHVLAGLLCLSKHIHTIMQSNLSDCNAILSKLNRLPSNTRTQGRLSPFLVLAVMRAVKAVVTYHSMANVGQPCCIVRNRPWIAILPKESKN